MKGIKSARFIAGVDEAGRGPLAGPVAVGAVMWERGDRVLVKALKKEFPVVKDSKQISPLERERMFGILSALQKTTTLRYAVALTPASVIDRRGIVFAIQSGVKKALKKIVGEGSGTFVMLDGSLKAPDEYAQSTYIRGDAEHLPIALASIVAKVTRDRHMERAGKRYPGYGFETHKGYGTKAHYEAIKKLGISPIHRRTFLKNFK